VDGFFKIMVQLGHLHTSSHSTNMCACCRAHTLLYFGWYQCTAFQCPPEDSNFHYGTGHIYHDDQLVAWFVSRSVFRYCSAPSHSCRCTPSAPSQSVYAPL
jgi:hypothetical protein